MKKPIHIAPQQPVEEAPEVEIERLQAIRSIESSLDMKAREADVDVNTAASILASIERECLLDERPESELDAARATHWKARKAQAQAHDALAVHKATYPTLAADIQRLAAEIERKKFQARHEEYQRRGAVLLALMEKAKGAAADMSSSWEDGFTPLPVVGQIFGNQFHAGEFGMLKKAIANAYPHLLDPMDPVSKEAKRVAEYIADHERSPITGMSPHQARHLGAVVKTLDAPTPEEKPGILAGLKSVFSIA